MKRCFLFRNVQKIPSKWHKGCCMIEFSYFFVGMGSSLNLLQHFTCQTSFPDFSTANARIAFLFRGRRMVSYPKVTRIAWSTRQLWQPLPPTYLGIRESAKVIKVNARCCQLVFLFIDFEALLPPSQCHSGSLVEECWLGCCWKNDP